MCTSLQKQQQKNKKIKLKSHIWKKHCVICFSSRWCFIVFFCTIHNISCRGGMRGILAIKAPAYKKRCNLIHFYCFYVSYQYNTEMRTEWVLRKTKEQKLSLESKVDKVWIMTNGWLHYCECNWQSHNSEKLLLFNW